MTAVNGLPGLPADVDAEKAILGTVLLDSDAHVEAVNLELVASDFFHDSHRRIWLCMTAMLEAGRAVDIVTLCDELERRREMQTVGGRSYLFGLTENLPHRLVITEYVGIVKKHRKKREAVAQAESVTGASILDWIVRFLLRFVSLTKEQAIASALWVVHTHAIDAADCTPYLAIDSAEKQSGKTRQLEVMKLLVREPWFTGRVSAAVLVRKIDAKQPSLLLDESDAAFGGDETYTEALRGILNSGYRRGGCASLCVGQGAAMTYNDFKTFSCKAIAGLNRLPDTIADRSIPIRLKRALRGTVERFRERDAEQEAKPQKAQIAVWCAAHVEELRNARPDIPSALSDRQADVCEPLLAIADAVGGEWPKTARTALLKLCVGAQADDGSNGVRLLRDIKTIFTDKNADEISSADLCEALAQVETSPWGEWSKGKPISKAKLAGLLKPFEVYPAPLSSGQTRGYRLDRFKEAFSLYIPPDSPYPPLQSVKVSDSQCPCGFEADFRVSNEILSDTLKNAVSANNDAGSRHLDTLKAEIGVSAGADTLPEDATKPEAEWL